VPGGPSRAGGRGREGAHVSPREERPASEPLAILAAFSEQLSSGDYPLDHLLAYCRTAAALRPRLRSIHIAFFSAASLVPLRVFYFDAREPGLVRLAAGDLSPHERKQFRRFSHRRTNGPAGRGGLTAQRADLERLDGFFRPGAACDVPASPPQGERSGPEDGAQRGEGPAKEPLPLRLPDVPDGWVFFTDEAGGRAWDAQARNALALCTDMLAAALERAGLFSRVLRAKKEWEGSMDAIRDVVMIVGPDHAVVRGNLHLSELAGVPVKALRGRRCHHLLASLETPCPGCPARVTFQTGEPRAAEVVRPRGGARVEAWSSPMPGPAGGPDAVVVYEKDVTEVRRMQAKLAQAEKMAVLGELAAAVAHELNNPLSGVISFSKILLTEMAPDAPHTEDVRTIESAALRCKKIVQDLLTFARKPGAVAHEPVSLQSVVEQVHAMLRPRLEEGGVRLTWRIPAGLPPLPYHPDLLHQVLLNLLANSLDASPPGGEVVISAARRRRKGAPRVEVSVRDRGHGIPSGARERVFEPFYTTKGPGRGTGLGLSICRKLMDAFGGEIEVASPRSGGTLVSLFFPLAETARRERGGPRGAD